MIVILFTNRFTKAKHIIRIQLNNKPIHIPNNSRFQLDTLLPTQIYCATNNPAAITHVNPEQMRTFRPQPVNKPFSKSPPSPLKRGGPLLMLTVWGRSSAGPSTNPKEDTCGNGEVLVEEERATNSLSFGRPALEDNSAANRGFSALVSTWLERGGVDLFELQTVESSIE